MIVHSNITEQVVQYFKENINSGNWKVGEKIPSESQLTEILGVSRASVRTAIRQLVGLGILESKHGKGTYLLDDHTDELTGSDMKITADDCKDIEKVLEFRRIVESEACYLAAEHTSPELVERLQKYLDDMVKSVGNKDGFVESDIMFHEEISKAADNMLLEKSLLKVFEETKKSHDQMNEIFGYKDGIYYHQLILKAIENGDAKKARKLMRDHLQNALERLEVGDNR